MSLRRSTVSGIKWSTASQFGRQGLTFIVTAVLARLLSPTDYGLIAMATVVTGFMELFKDLGTGAAIVHRLDPSERLLSGLFWVNAGIGLLLTAITFFISPLIGLFYHEPRVGMILKVMALSFSLSGFGIVHLALLQKKLSFDVIAKAELAGSILAGTTAVILAILGAGVWSLVAQILTSVSVTTIGFWLGSSWRPGWCCSWTEIRSVSAYSLNLTGFNLFNYFSRNADYILIGRFLGGQELGYYTLAYRLMLYPLQSVTSIVGRVLFPVFSRIQEDNRRFQNAYLKTCASIALVTFPMMMGLWVVADSFILGVLGARWAPVVPLIRILAPVGMAQSIVATVGTIYQAKGRTDWIFYWGIFSGTFLILCFATGIRFGLLGVAWAYFIAAVILTPLNFIIPFRLIELRLRSLFHAIRRPFLCSLLMLLAVAPLVAYLPVGMDPILKLAIVIPSGIAAYAIATGAFNRAHLAELVVTLKERTDQNR